VREDDRNARRSESRGDWPCCTMGTWSRPRPKPRGCLVRGRAEAPAAGGAGRLPHRRGAGLEVRRELREAGSRVHREQADPEVRASHSEEVVEPEVRTSRPEEVADPEVRTSHPEEVADPEVRTSHPEEVADPEVRESHPEVEGGRVVKADRQRPRVEAGQRAGLRRDREPQWGCCCVREVERLARAERAGPSEVVVARGLAGARHRLAAASSRTRDRTCSGPGFPSRRWDR
jgi:hypothetical protein